MAWRSGRGDPASDARTHLAPFLLLWLAFAAGCRETATDRCPPGLAPVGARCCAPGQTLSDGLCAGAPAQCPEGLAATPSGCVAEPRLLPVAGGRLGPAPADWQAAPSAHDGAAVEAFHMDAFEVTFARWTRCAAAGRCAPRQGEPGVPVTAVTPEQAERFCAHERGRLPTGAEWLLAASGEVRRRWPWGPTGLVCRRAAFGLEEGPCARGATGPELAGARPDGATAGGFHDLSGNVAELTREPGGAYRARGGSYRSRGAAELATHASRPVSGPEPDVGFRCVRP